MIDVEHHGSVIAIRMARSLLGRPLYWTAAYWVDGLLIDTGPACTARQLLRVLEQVPVEQIAVTHAHEDHIGGLALLRARYPDAPIYAPRAAVDLVRDPEKLGLQLYRKLVWGVPRSVADVRSLDDADDLLTTKEFTFRAVETPGHSRDHVAYFEPRYRWLFSGDAFIGGRDTAWAGEFDFFAIVSSLRTLASMRPERLFPGSGHVRRTPQAELHGKVNDLLQLSREAGKLDAAGYSVAEMVEMLFDGEPRLRFWTQGHFSAANLLRSALEYNHVVAPVDAAASPDLPRPPRKRSDDPQDPPASRSLDTR
jgi:glyoxylase-like metal-dependent hydrolase (beta-lactamase superfamily II)